VEPGQGPEGLIGNAGLRREDLGVGLGHERGHRMITLR
jgi:hypothetical protein